MITIGKVNKIIDVIGYNNNNELVYLGRDSGSPETELDNKNHAFFDTNNITYLKTTPIIYSKVEETKTDSFINSAKFYTCSENAQTSLCFTCASRCYSNCTSCNGCNSCTTCHSCTACDACESCYGCNSCDSSCNGCDGCNSCNGCNSNN